MRQKIPAPAPEHPDWGFDIHDFWSLGGRLVPCGPAHMMNAVDLSLRLWWWSSENAQWFLVPDDQYERRFAEIGAWRSIAPSAVDALATYFSCDKDSPAVANHFGRFVAIQDTFLRVQDFRCPWEGGWLYRSLLLDHRWLLPRFTLPEFDEYAFAIMITTAWGGMPDEGTVQWLKDDPVIVEMPALYEMVYPDSWKTGIILGLKERGIFANVTDVDRALERLATSGRLANGQSELLRSMNGPLKDSSLVGNARRGCHRVGVGTPEFPECRQPRPVRAFCSVDRRPGAGSGRAPDNLVSSASRRGAGTIPGGHEGR